VVDEIGGTEVLVRVFESRGFRVVRNFPFREGSVSFEIDGWDPTARVGFELLTTEAADHEDLTEGEFVRLSEAIARGDLDVFVVDETEVGDEYDLAEQARAFLDAVAVKRRRRAAGAAAVAPARAPAAPVVVKPAPTTRPTPSPAAKPAASARAAQPATKPASSSAKARAQPKKAAKKKTAKKKRAPVVAPKRKKPAKKRAKSARKKTPKAKPGRTARSTTKKRARATPA
jgi:hypothetical protein